MLRKQESNLRLKGMNLVSYHYSIPLCRGHSSNECDLSERESFFELIGGKTTTNWLIKRTITISHHPYIISQVLHKNFMRLCKRNEPVPMESAHCSSVPSRQDFRSPPFTQRERNSVMLRPPFATGPLQLYHSLPVQLTS